MIARLTAAGRIALVALAVASLPGPAGAVEPAKEFLGGLRERGLHDYALRYLEQMRASPLVSEEFRQSIDLEVAVTLADAAGKTQDPAAQEEQIRQAIAAFKKCLQTGGEGHPLRGAALRSLGRTQMALASLQRAQAERPVNVARKPEQLASSRGLFTEAGKSFSDAIAFYHRRKDELARSTAPNKKELEEERRGGVLAALLLEATADLEGARTYEPAAPEARKLLARAAERFGYVAEQYRRRPEGAEAALRQGECFQRLGEGDKALGVVEPLLNWSPAGPEVQAEATRLYLEVATGEKQKKYAEAVEVGEGFLSRATDDRAASALAVRYFTALAYQGLAASAKKEDALARRNLTEARKHARHVARFSGPYQQQAQDLLVRLGRGEAAPEDAGPTTFAAARAKADLARDAWQVALQAAQLAAAGGDPQVAKTQQAEADDKRALAFEGYQLALRWADHDTPADDLAQVRYVLAYLYWDQGQYEPAAVLADYLARHDPKHPLSAKAAQIGLAAYQKLAQDAPEGERDFAYRRVQSLAEHIVATWPDRPEADAALITLLEAATQRGDLAAARAQLDKIPPDSPRRAQAELRAGQVLWSAYRRRIVAAAPAAETQPPADEADAERLRLAAQQTLEAGYGRLQQKGAVDPAAVGGVLALVQLYLDAGYGDKALPLLEDAKLGLLPLIAARKLAADSPAVGEIYKTALRAYVSADPPRLEDAEKTMDALDKSAAADAQAAAGLTRVYVGLGRELQAQVEALERRGEQDRAQATRQSLEAFLQRVGGRKEGQNYQTLSWLAETYYTLAGGSAAVQAPRPGPAAKKHLGQAAEIYARLLADGQRDPAVLPKPELADALRLRLAQCRRRLGEFQSATDVLVALLEDKPTLLVAQAEAARVLQDRGEVDNPEYLRKAIAGDVPVDGRRNLIWGWGRLAQLVAKQPSLSETFHEARLNLAACRYRLAQRGPADQRPTLLKAAKNDIVIMTRLYAEMGGPVWRERYDRLLKQIQRDLGEPAVGLSAVAPLPGPVARGAAPPPAASQSSR